jgi:membrane fusion protein, hemolysin D
MVARVLSFFAKGQRIDARGAVERAFLPAALEVVETPASPTMRVSAGLISGFLLTAIVWSFLGHVDIVATARGKVIARERTQVIQPSDTSEVREIDVAEGDHVNAGQVLIKLDPTIATADEGRFSDALLQTELDRARLRAELTPATSVPFAGLQAPPDLLAAARARLDSEMREEDEKIAKIDAETVQKKADEAEIDAEVAKIDAALPFVQARADIRRHGMETQFGTKLDYYQQQQKLVEMQHDRIVDQRKHEAAEAALSTLATERAETEAEFRSSAYADLAKADRDAAQAAGELTKARHRAELQTLTAPVAGIVQDLSVHTVGGVVTPAQQLMRIVPTDGGIEVEAMVANRDVGFVKVGQDVEVKVDTFPFTRYGLIHGYVSELAHDSVEQTSGDQPRGGSLAAGDAPAGIEGSQQLVYTARIALDQTHLDVDRKIAELEPGMAVTAEIKTGKRRVLDYLLSPLYRYSHNVLRER